MGSRAFASKACGSESDRLTSALCAYPGPAASIRVTVVVVMEKVTAG